MGRTLVHACHRCGCRTVGDLDAPGAADAVLSGRVPRAYPACRCRCHGPAPAPPPGGGVLVRDDDGRAAGVLAGLAAAAAALGYGAWRSLRRRR